MNLPQAYMCPHPEPSSLLLPTPSLWVVPVHQPQASSICLFYNFDKHGKSCCLFNHETLLCFMIEFQITPQQNGKLIIIPPNYFHFHC